jgi:threonine dehydratase
VRGALHALEKAVARGSIAEVIAASTGNHGAAVAYAAKLLGVSARIFLPANSNPVKVNRIRDQGATVVESGADLSAAIALAEDDARRTGTMFLHDASDPDIPAGTATIGAEILEQLPTVDAVYVPMGDTALIRGVASALRDSTRPVRVVGVVAAQAPAYYLSWKAGEVVETASAATIADGLAVRRPLAPNVSAVRELVDEVVLVDEIAMLEAIGYLESASGLVAEPSGAAALAAVLRRAEPRSKTVALVTGRNISPEVANRVRRSGARS